MFSGFKLLAITLISCVAFTSAHSFNHHDEGTQPRDHDDDRHLQVFGQELYPVLWVKSILAENIKTSADGLFYSFNIRIVEGNCLPGVEVEVTIVTLDDISACTTDYEGSCTTDTITVSTTSFLTYCSVTKLHKSNNDRVAFDTSSDSSAFILVPPPNVTRPAIGGNIKANLGLEDKGEWTATALVVGAFSPFLGSSLVITAEVLNFTQRFIDRCEIGVLNPGECVSGIFRFEKDIELAIFTFLGPFGLPIGGVAVPKPTVDDFECSVPSDESSVSVGPASSPSSSKPTNKQTKKQTKKQKKKQTKKQKKKPTKKHKKKRNKKPAKKHKKKRNKKPTKTKPIKKPTPYPTQYYSDPDYELDSVPEYVLEYELDYQTDYPTDYQSGPEADTALDYEADPEADYEADYETEADTVDADAPPHRVRKLGSPQ